MAARVTTCGQPWCTDADLCPVALGLAPMHNAPGSPRMTARTAFAGWYLDALKQRHHPTLDDAFGAGWRAHRSLTHAD